MTDDTTPPDVDVPPDSSPAPDAAEEAAPPMSKSRPKLPRGALDAFITEHDDPARTIAESARRLTTLAHKQGLPTTTMSLAQKISIMRRQGGGRVKGDGAPSGAKQRRQAVSTLDDAIAGLQLLKEYVERLETENEEYKARIAKAQALVAALAG